MQNLLQFPDILRTLAAILVGAIILAQLVYLFLPSDDEPVDEIREERSKRP